MESNDGTMAGLRGGRALPSRRKKASAHPLAHHLQKQRPLTIKEKEKETKQRAAVQREEGRRLSGDGNAVARAVFFGDEAWQRGWTGEV